MNLNIIYFSNYIFPIFSNIVSANIDMLLYFSTPSLPTSIHLFHYRINDSQHRSMCPEVSTLFEPHIQSLHYP